LLGSGKISLGKKNSQSNIDDICKQTTCFSLMFSIRIFIPLSSKDLNQSILISIPDPDYCKNKEPFKTIFICLVYIGVL
jgi:hypothetical protein